MNKLPPEYDNCGCDKRTGQRDLVSVDTAVARGLRLCNTVSTTETIGLEAAIGRVLATDLFAPFSLPPFDNSAMDGYALRHDDLTGTSPSKLTLTGRIAAGDDAASTGPLGPGEAFRIFTGAGIPPGADTVIMQERVLREGDTITIDHPVRRGNDIRRMGEDAPSGSLLLQRGTQIDAREVGAIASVGLARVEVFRKIRIALLCTGSELRQPGETLAPGQIYNSNRFILLAALRKPWVEVIDLGAIKDDPAVLRETLSSAANQADIILTTGGVSVGEEDHMVDQFRAAGGEIEVLKIAMKPGKPLSMGRLRDAVFIGLPGNPVAAFTTWKIIGSQIAAKVAGVRASNRRRSVVEAAHLSTRRPGRQEFRPARVVGMSKSGHPRVALLDKSFSAKISLICKSDGFAVIPADIQNVRSGDKLEFVYL